MEQTYYLHHSDTKETSSFGPVGKFSELVEVTHGPPASRPNDAEPNPKIVSDEMSEFTTLENWMQIRITHFVHWGKARSNADSKVVEIDEAREVWKKLVGHGYVREIGAENSIVNWDRFQ